MTKLMPWVTLCALCVAAAGSDQTKPDFSGTWSIVAARSTGPASFGARFVARQTATELVVERTVGEAVSTVTYRLDGTETKNSLTNVVQSDSLSKARWDGARLVIESHLVNPQPNVSTDFRRVLTLASDGLLIVEMTANPGNKLSTSAYSRNPSAVFADSGRPIATALGRSELPTGESVQTVTVTVGEKGFEPVGVPLRAGVPARLTFVRTTDTCP
jgi:hypothetical protein